MWNAIKHQIVEKIIEEFKSENNRTLIKKYLDDDFIDKYLIFPLLTKLNIHMKKYVIIFIAVHILIILLIIFNIFISIHYKK